MPVTTVVSGDKFTIRVIKHHHNNPSDTWANSYEFVANSAGAEAELLLCGDAVVAFEKAMHKDVVEFDRLTISTWAPDSVPYDPTAFISVALTGTGTIGEVVGTQPLNVCLSVARVTAYGRFGHIFYRGFLDFGDTEAPAGKAVLVDPTGVQSIIAAALTSSTLDEFIGLSPEQVLGLSLISKDGTQVRPVVGLFQSGVTTLPTDHAWFNRTASP